MAAAVVVLLDMADVIDCFMGGLFLAGLFFDCCCCCFSR